MDPLCPVNGYLVIGYTFGGGEVMIVIAMHEQVRRRVQRMDAYRFRRTLSPLVMEWIVHRLMIELGYSTLYLLSEMDEFD